MPRPPRLLLTQSYYHIMTRGNNKNVVFKTENDYVYYLDLLVRFKKQHPFDLFHYCLMPNHVHLLVKTNKASDFSIFMKKLNLAYFHYFRKKYGWVGHFWQDRYKSQPVGKDEYFIQCGKYIELNPVRSGLVKDPKKYKYSSFRHYAKGLKIWFLTNDIFYEQMGEDSKKRQLEYEKIMIAEIVPENYLRTTWGSNYQRYQENKKKRYNLG